MPARGPQLLKVRTGATAVKVCPAGPSCSGRPGWYRSRRSPSDSVSRFLMRQVSSTKPAVVVRLLFDTFGPSRICTCVGTALLSVETQLQTFPYERTGASAPSTMYSPPTRNVWLPLQPFFVTLTEPLTC